jgi:hypothetical protein
MQVPFSKIKGKKSQLTPPLIIISGKMNDLSQEKKFWEIFGRKLNLCKEDERLFAQKKAALL